jgi:hypothetical protein
MSSFSEGGLSSHPQEEYVMQRLDISLEEIWTALILIITV